MLLKNEIWYGTAKNTFKTGENAGFQYFHLFLQCYQNACSQ